MVAREVETRIKVLVINTERRSCRKVPAIISFYVRRTLKKAGARPNHKIKV